ncbi:MAG TPA: hypothetical protein DDX92_01050 [Flavobacteriales bacterium]|jgi:hypothetical protein|nr:hypothetical protein [Flavobacteriales bacterium]
MSSLRSNAQVTAEAGNSFHSCPGDANSDSVMIGGMPTASGGFAPYTYEWSIEPIELGFPGSGLFFYASDILTDSTIANPLIIDRFASDTIAFFLKVTDSNGSTSLDSCIVTFSNFGITLKSYVYIINAGDSVWMDMGVNIGGGLPPETFLWQPLRMV